MLFSTLFFFFKFLIHPLSAEHSDGPDDRRRNGLVQFWRQTDHQLRTVHGRTRQPQNTHSEMDRGLSKSGEEQIEAVDRKDEEWGWTEGMLFSKNNSLMKYDKWDWTEVKFFNPKAIFVLGKESKPRVLIKNNFWNRIFCQFLSKPI